VGKLPVQTADRSGGNSVQGGKPISVTDVLRRIKSLDIEKKIQEMSPALTGVRLTYKKYALKSNYQTSTFAFLPKRGMYGKAIFGKK
jgi:hypothetical protein